MSDTKSAKEIAAQEFDGIEIVKPYGELLGNIALPAIGFIWGKSYSGKSTLALGIANALAEYGRVEYVPAEEHFSITLTKKVNRLKAYNNNLVFRRYKGLDNLRKHLKDVDVKVVFIDSVSVLDANDKEVIAFAQWCRERNIGMWMISHANKDGSYKGNSKFGHEADIKIEVLPDNNMAHSRKNRFDDGPRSIPVPFTAKDIDWNSSKSGKKKKKSGKKASANDDFDAQMDEVEDLLKSA